jgi:hypothetical protein
MKNEKCSMKMEHELRFLFSEKICNEIRPGSSG